MALSERAAEQDDAGAEVAATEQQLPDPSSDVVAIALQMMLRHGWTGAIYVARDYAVQRAWEGNPAAEEWWMCVLVAVVSMRDLPAGWARAPADLH